MKKFVRYLYEYRNGNRVQNVGFVRVETSGNMTGIQIYGKGFPATGRQPLEIFLFYMEEMTCVGIPAGQMRVSGQMINHRMEVPNIRPDVNGIIIRGERRGYPVWYAGVWEDRMVDVEHMILQEEMQEPQMPEPETQIEEPQMEPDVEEEMEKKPETGINKITRQDLAKLPRREWKLANNHFLMHGCRNFHHLISFKKEGAYWLGVPGVYHPNEQRAAEAFGFGQFMKPEEGELSLTEDEYTKQGDFGYWCRTVSNLIR